MILRPDYIRAISPFIDTHLVKILSGVRRCGKSTILSMVEQLLLERGSGQENIIRRNYSDIAYDDFTAKDMSEDLKKALAGSGKCYLLLDELQEVKGWEKVVNSLLEKEAVDIYVTGSNSKLMSSEISTYLTGRYVSIPVYTLSFKEFLEFKGKTQDDKRAVFDEYLLYGGFPIIGISSFDTASAYQVVEGIYAAVITRDISKRHKIRNKDLFDGVVRFIVENVGKTFSANSVRNFLKSEGRNVSIESVYNYIKWLSEAFIIYPCQRYDLRGKAVLKTQEKYYLSDISLKYSQMGFNRKMLSAILENIVYLEMRRRNYEVYIGKLGDKEIDFIGVRRDVRIYIQVCDQLPEDSSRETENLMNIKDHYHKYVVCRDSLAIGNDNGIEIVHIADFLLADNW
ncbi:MAG: ATP-binding protein [Succiniclasticum sp.]|uniref:ATP-binding protein n=1 Tax=Succiniclasticum sp. TaxID=2775030 RepID=UPI002A910B69|nr:ATP-binding protein [Succiniclasticum sp.]MDY6290481.1 ATP-binding protein [Succiniclasticum sp.]